MFYNHELSANEVLIYLRKSRSDDPAMTVEEVLARHEAILNEWCDNNLHCAIPEENIYREVASGETISDRPEIQRLLRKIESPAISAVLVVEVQRLSRGDLEDAGRLIKLFRHTNTMVITPQFTYDISNEYDRDIFERELKRGNEFLEYQKKIMSRGRLLSVSQGNYIGSVPPYGYDKTFVQDGRRKCPTLSINEDEATAVRLIFDLYVNKNMGCPNIAHYLDEHGFKPRRGEHWSPAAIKDMLTNVHYTGKVVWNRRKTVTLVENSTFHTSRPKSDDYLIYDGKHEAIISDELFTAAEEKRGRSHRAKGTTKVRNPLAGLIYCKCGRAMSLRTYTRNGKTRSAARLLCDNQTHCNTSSCTYAEMEELVCNILSDAISDFRLALEADNENDRLIHEKIIESLKTRLDKARQKEIAQWENYTNPDSYMPEHVFKQLNEQVLKEKHELLAALEHAYASAPTQIDYKERIARFKAALNALSDDTFDAEHKNTLLKSCIDRITYDREKEYHEYRKVRRCRPAKIMLDVALRI